MSILRKMAVFIKKPPVTNSNCYETIKNDSILMELGTNVDYTITSVTACSMVNSCYHGNGGTSQNCQK
jgi:hypothetical protein